NEVTKANSAPEMIPGRINGMMTLKKVVRGLAPNDCAARISVWSKPVSVAVTVMMTKGMPRTAWATITPRWEFARQPFSDRNIPKTELMALSGAMQALA